MWHGATKEDQEGSVKMAVYPEQQDCWDYSFFILPE